MVLGALAAGSFAAGWWHSIDQPSEDLAFDPAPELRSQDKPDNVFKFGSWNIQRHSYTHAENVVKLFKQEDLDALALQEVTGNQARWLGELVAEKGLYLRFKVGDRKSAVLEGGEGVALITREKPRDVTWAHIKGNSLGNFVTRTVNKLGTDVAQANTSFSNTKDGLIQTRVALAETIKVEHEGRLIDIRIATTHIASKGKYLRDADIHNAQFAELRKFLRKNNKPGRPTVIGGDFNDIRKEVREEVVKEGMLHAESTDELSTSLSIYHRGHPGGYKIDHVAYYEADKLGEGTVKTLKHPTTDHRPIVATWELPE